MAVFNSIGAAIFGAGTLMASVAAATLQIAAGLAVNYFVSSLNGQADESQYAGMQGTLQVGADIPRTIPFGWALAEPSLAYANYWGEVDGTPNAYLTQVISLGDYPVKGLSELYIDGSIDTPLWAEAGTMGAPLSGKRRDGVDYAWVKFYDGTQTTADAWLVSQFGTHGERPYSAARVGFGVPYLILTTRVHEELWTGFPAVKAALHGAKIYDISKDSSRGGVGTQRADQPTTWGGDGDDLVAVQAYALFMGVRFNGQWLYGLQNLPLAQLPDAAWVAQVNACRAAVTGAEGTEPAYRSGASIAVDRAIADTLKSLATSCQGRVVEVGGEYRWYVGAAGAPVAHITDGDVLSTEERSFAPFFGLADTVNGIAATHPSPDNGWNSLPLATLLRTDLEAADGNRRLLADVSLDFVPYSWQAQRLMQQALAEARRERKLTLVLPGSFYLPLPGECITFTSEANGFIDKLFRIEGAGDLSSGNVIWDITEIDPDDYDPDFATYQPPVVGSLLPPVVPVQVAQAWNVVGVVSVDEQSRARRAAALWTWDGSVDDVRAVAFEARFRSGSEAGTMVLTESTERVSAGTIEYVGGRLFPGSALEGRIKYLPRGSRPTDWTGWLPFDLPDVRLSIYDIDEEFRKFTGVLGGAGSLIERFDTLQDRLEELAESVLKTGATGRVERRELEATQNGNKAYFLEQITVLVDEDQALADLITLLEAEFDDNVAFVGSQLTALATADSVLASAITEVAGEVDGVSASGRYGVTVSIGPTGWELQFAVVLRVTEGGAQYETGTIWLLNSLTGRGAIANKASEWLLYDEVGGALVQLVSFIGPDAYFQNVHVAGDLVVAGSLTATQIGLNQIVTGGTSTPTGSINLTTDEQVVATFIHTANEGSFAVMGTVYMPWSNLNSSAYGNVTLRLRKNGTVFATKTVFVDDNFTGDYTLIGGDYAAGVATNTYTMTAQADSSGPTLEHKTSSAQITIIGGSR